MSLFWGKNLDFEFQTKKAPKKGPQLGAPSQLRSFDQKENLDPVVIRPSNNDEPIKAEITKPLENLAKPSQKPKNFDAAYRELKKDLIKKQLNNGNDLTAVDLLVNPVEFVTSQTTKEQTKREDFFLKPESKDAERTRLNSQPIKKGNSKEKVDSKPTVRASAKASVRSSKSRNEELFISEDLRECTFTPKTNNNVKARRTFDEFLENQQKFQQNVEEKKKRVRNRNLLLYFYFKNKKFRLTNKILFKAKI